MCNFNLLFFVVTDCSSLNLKFTSFSNFSKVLVPSIFTEIQCQIIISICGLHANYSIEINNVWCFTWHHEVDRKWEHPVGGRNYKARTYNKGLELRQKMGEKILFPAKVQNLFLCYIDIFWVPVLWSQLHLLKILILCTVLTSDK